MTVKTTGAEFKRYYNDDQAWPDDAWHDGIEVRVDGVDLGDESVEGIGDGAKVEIVSGDVFLPENDDSICILKHFRKWLKNQNTAALMVECPKDKLEAVKAAIQSAGGKAL